MKKLVSLSVCVLLLITVMLSGCGKKNIDNQSSDGQGGSTLSYSDAIEAGDYVAAYEALLAGAEGTDPNDLNKFLVLPTKVECDDRDGKYTVTLTYNSNGLLEKVDMPKTKASPEAITFTYDDAGRIATETHLWGKNLDVDSVRAYTYDDNGKLIKNYTDYSSGRKVYIDYTYNELGQVATDTITTYSGYSYEPEPTIEVFYSTYDANGNLLSRKTNENHGRAYTYDDKNRLLTECDLSKHIGEYNKHTYTYDDNGRLIKERYDNIDDPDWWTETHYAYDVNGTRYKVLYIDRGDEEAYTYVNTFDNGRIVTYTYTERDDNEYRIYNFDEVGNIIKAVNYKDGVENYNYTFAYDKFGCRTLERYENANSHYEYAVSYTVLYYPNGAPELSEYIKEFTEQDSLQYFF